MTQTNNAAGISCGLLLDRRRLIAGAAAGATALLAPIPAAATTGELRLAFHNLHNNERFDAVFARGGQLVASGLAELNHGLRDWRTGEMSPIDFQLLGLLVRLRDGLGVPARHPIELISGYRSPHTNAALRAASRAHSGVASKSQHMLGKAADIRISGQSLDKTRAAAISLRGGGVGYYPKDGFVHVDSGPVRYW